MIRMMCKSKIQNLVVTEANVNYSGSISIDSYLLEKANIKPYEMILVVNLDNGERLETYAIPAKKNSGTVGLQGGAAKKGKVGDKLIIMSYLYVYEGELAKFKHKIIIAGENNCILEEKDGPY